MLAVGERIYFRSAIFPVRRNPQKVVASQSKLKLKPSVQEPTAHTTTTRRTTTRKSHSTGKQNVNNTTAVVSQGHEFPLKCNLNLILIKSHHLFHLQDSNRH